MKKTFYDSFSRSYFEASPDDVLAAEQSVNDELIKKHYLDLNAFYSRLGIKELEICELLKDPEWRGPIDILEFVHSRAVLNDGMEIYILSFRFWPLHSWLNDICQ